MPGSADPRSQPLAQFVRVQTRGVRSVNITHDRVKPTTVHEYILTGQSLATLGRIVSGAQGAILSRAWTLTGPYGSGKSAFALFLMNLCSSGLPAHADALAKLRQADPLLADEVLAAFAPERSGGLLPVAVTGQRAPFITLIGEALQETMAEAELPGTDHLRGRLTRVTNAGDEAALLDWLTELHTCIRQSGRYHGILLVFDEMGKALEYASHNTHRADVYLLQQLAELANRSGTHPFILIGILHQAFERYADLLDQRSQQDWAKVQGRFEDVAFQEPPHQQMRLLARVFEHDFPAETWHYLRRQMLAEVREAVRGGWCPAVMTADEFEALCERVYPLHPSAFVALPYLFRRLAQNERSLLAFLTSSEPAGFQDYVAYHTPGEFLRLSDVFDYVHANHHWRLLSAGRGHIFAEALERLNSDPELPPSHSALLKTIALINWLGETGPFKATEAMLVSAVGTNGLAQGDLRRLREQSHITYRAFNETYALWQGSDVDLEERLEAGRRSLSQMFSPALALQKYLPPRPLLAHRHSHQSGTLRLFEVRYVDSVTYAKTDFTFSLPHASGLVLLCLPTHPAEVQAFVRWAMEGAPRDHAQVIVGIPGQALRLNQLLFEMQCLHWVWENTPALSGDAVARRELRIRLATIENLVHEQIARSLSMHRLAQAPESRWFWRGKPAPLDPCRGLSAFLSQLCDSLYQGAPRVWNELLNRHALTSQGAAARRNLIEAMLLRSHLPDLGITGHPPERSMYESLLKQGGLHRPSGANGWAFCPPPADDPLRLSPLWRAVADFVFQSPPQPRGLEQLYAILSAPPYGLTQGVLPVLLCAFAMAHHDEVTLYREGTLLPEPGVADWEVLLRRPDLFAIAGYRTTPQRAAILERFGRGLGVKPATLPIVRRLVVQLKSLPEHAWRTRRLPETALAVRHAVQSARSPEQLLFCDLPQALDLPPFTEESPAADRIEMFFDRLNEALSALAHATPRLRQWARDEFLKACALPASDAGWADFLELARALSGRVTQPQLLPLLKRAAEAADADIALESVLAYVANRPLRTWTDADADRFVGQSSRLGELLRSERGQETCPPPLSPEMVRRSEEFVAQLRALLRDHLEDDPRIVQAALQMLLRDLRDGKNG
jgi:hypothetical protein